SDREQVRVAHSAYSYLSSSDPRAHFGLGSTGVLEHIEVRWPDGSVERFDAPKTNRVVELVQGAGD
ncbi:MAG: ASPIC/UnbV domain-containing protein, partial [Pirellulaceae bacterium]|nr:ASPIC/UnbV domain-containing protein [Pirellulaceae bacterium]